MTSNSSSLRSHNITLLDNASTSSYDCITDIDGYDMVCTSNDQSQVFILEDDLCEFVEGCTDNGTFANKLGEINDADGDLLPAFNYNPEAVIDDGSCEYPPLGNLSLENFNYQNEFNWRYSIIDIIFKVCKEQIPKC